MVLIAIIVTQCVYQLHLVTKQAQVGVCVPPVLYFRQDLALVYVLGTAG